MTGIPHFQRRPTFLPVTRRGPAPVWILALIVAAAMAIPLVYLVIRAAQADADAWRELTRSSTYNLLKNTVLLAGAVTATSVALALPMAWLTVRSDIPWRRFWSVVTVLPLVIPSFVGGLAFIAALGPHGSFQRLLEPLGVASLPDIFGFTGAWLTLSLFTYPYLLITLRSGLRGIDPAMEEASRALGIGPWSTFRRVIVPQLRVPLAAGSLLVALYVISDFGAVSLLRFDTLTVSIFSKFRTFDRPAAAVISLLLVGLVILVLSAESRTRGRGRYYQSGASIPRQPRVTHLGRWKWPATAFLTLITLLALAVPIAVLLDWLVRGLRAGEPFQDTWTAAWHSISVSAVAGLVAVFAAIPVATVAVRHRSILSGLIERMSYLGFALPGIVVALSLVFFSLSVIPGLYQNWNVLIFSYIVLFFPQALGPVRSSFVRVKPSIEEAARGLGRGPAWVAATVTIPLLAPGLIGGFALVFLTTMKELPATLLLAPIEFDTLSTQVWGAADEAFFARAAAPALMLILFSAIPMALILGRDHRLRD